MNISIVDDDRYQATYHWAESVWRLSDVELLVVTLAFPRSHIVDDGVAPNVVHCFILVDAEALLANDDTQFTFVVDGFGEFGVRMDFVAIADYG